MLVKQMSVFVENTTGRLCELTKVLAQNDIDIKAMCIADTVDFGILRCIVDDPEKATAVLKSKGFTELNDKPGGLASVLEILSSEGISVDYIYSTIRSRNGYALIVIKVADPEKAIQLLQDNGISLFSKEDFL